MKNLNENMREKARGKKGDIREKRSEKERNRKVCVTEEVVKQREREKRKSETEK
jgi:hypothetical protein